MKWNTRFTKVFPCRVPIMGAPMAGASGAELAIETCRAGGLGFIAAGHLNSQDSLQALEGQIYRFRELSDGIKYPLCLGFISHGTFGTELGWELFEDVLERHKPDVVQFFAGSVESLSSDDRNTNAVQVAQTAGCQVMMQVGTTVDAETAFELQVDAVIAQGTEAGGHGVRRELGSGTLSLASKLVDMRLKKLARSSITILAAGGITDGRDLAAILALGVDGGVLGTRLWASQEAMGPTSFKDALVAASSGDDVVRTQVFDTIANSYRPIKWPFPFDSSGVLRNQATELFDRENNDDIENLATKLSTKEGQDIVQRFQSATQKNDPTFAAVYAGKGVGKITSIEPAYDLVTTIENESASILQSLPQLVEGDTV